MGFLDDELKKQPDPDDEQGWRVLELAEPGILDRYRKCIADYALLGAEDPAELSAAFKAAARRALEGLARDGGNVFDAKVSDSNTSRNIASFRSSLKEAEAWWRDSARPQIRDRSLDVARLVVDLEGERANLRAALEEATELLTALRAKSGEVGAASLASHYESQAESYKSSARWSLGFLVALTVGAATAGWWLLSAVPESKDWPEVVPEVLARAALIGALSFGAAFSGKLYRSSTHLRAAYDLKANALKTFPLFSVSVDDPESRTLVLAELVRSVFSPTDTGLVATNSDTTVIESAAPLLNALSRQKA